MSDDTVKKLFQDRLDLFLQTYHKYKKIINFEYDPSKETSYQQLIIARKGQSFCYEFNLLLKREYMLYFRDPILTVILFTLWIIFALFNLLLFNSMTSVKKDTIVAISDRAGAIFNGVATMSFSGLNNGGQKLLSNRGIYKRELAGHLYNPTTYFITNYIYTIPFEIAVQFTFFNIYFWFTTLVHGSSYLWALHFLNL